MSGAISVESMRTRTGASVSFRIWCAPSLPRGNATTSPSNRRPPPYRFTSNPSLSLDVFGKTEAAGQRGVGEEGDLVDLAAAQGEHHHAPGLRAQVVAEGRLAVGAGRA